MLLPCAKNMAVISFKQKLWGELGQLRCGELAPVLGFSLENTQAYTEKIKRKTIILAMSHHCNGLQYKLVKPCIHFQSLYYSNIN